MVIPRRYRSRFRYCPIVANTAAPGQRLYTPGIPASVGFQDEIAGVSAGAIRSDAQDAGAQDADAQDADAEDA